MDIRDEIEKLHDHVDHRFDKLESKIDSFSSETIKNTNDLTWIKGGVTISLTSLLGILGYLLMQYFQSLGK